MIWACGFEKRRERKWTNIVSYKPRMYICVYGTSACVCTRVCMDVCDTCAVIIKFFTWNLPEMLGEFAIGPKRIFAFSNHSTATISLPLCKCNRCEAHTLKPVHHRISHFDAVLIQFSQFLFLHITYAIISLIFLAFMGEKCRIFASNEIHFAYHSKYLYSFVGNLEPFSVQGGKNTLLRINVQAGQKGAVYYPFP